MIKLQIVVLGLVVMSSCSQGFITSLMMEGLANIFDDDYEDTQINYHPCYQVCNPQQRRLQKCINCMRLYRNGDRQTLSTREQGLIRENQRLREQRRQLEIRENDLRVRMEQSNILQLNNVPIQNNNGMQGPLLNQGQLGIQQPLLTTTNVLQNGMPGVIPNLAQISVQQQPQMALGSLNYDISGIRPNAGQLVIQQPSLISNLHNINGMPGSTSSSLGMQTVIPGAGTNYGISGTLPNSGQITVQQPSPISGMQNTNVMPSSTPALFGIQNGIPGAITKLPQSQMSLASPNYGASVTNAEQQKNQPYSLISGIKNSNGTSDSSSTSFAMQNIIPGVPNLVEPQQPQPALGSPNYGMSRTRPNGVLSIQQTSLSPNIQNGMPGMTRLSTQQPSQISNENVSNNQNNSQISTQQPSVNQNNNVMPELTSNLAQNTEQLNVSKDVQISNQEDKNTSNTNRQFIIVTENEDEEP